MVGIDELVVVVVGCEGGASRKGRKIAKGLKWSGGEEDMTLPWRDKGVEFSDMELKPKLRCS